VIVDRVNPTITVHNVGVLGAALTEYQATTSPMQGGK